LKEGFFIGKKVGIIMNESETKLFARTEFEMSQGMCLMKFGGASLENADAICASSHSVLSFEEQGRFPIVVVSAMRGVTDVLRELHYERANTKVATEIFKSVLGVHVNTVFDLNLGDQLSMDVLTKLYRLGLTTPREPSAVQTPHELHFLDLVHAEVSPASLPNLHPRVHEEHPIPHDEVLCAGDETPAPLASRMHSLQPLLSSLRSSPRSRYVSVSLHPAGASVCDLLTAVQEWWGR